MRRFILIVILALAACDEPQSEASRLVSAAAEPTGVDEDHPAFAMTLADYKSLNPGERAGLVERFVRVREIDLADAETYRRCMGDFAHDKSDTLAFSEVFGWCETESANNRERFEDHFDELDAKDESTMAFVQCKNFVSDRLTSPASADFPFLDHQIIKRGRWRYLVKSYVDAENAFGAMIRLDIYCDLQFTGAGGSEDQRMWTLHNIELVPR